MKQTIKIAKQTGTHKQDESRSSKDKTNMPDYLDCSKIKTHMPDYFNSSHNKEADKRVSTAATNRINNEINNLFSGIGCFKVHFPCR